MKKGLFILTEEMYKDYIDRNWMNGSIDKFALVKAFYSEWYDLFNIVGEKKNLNGREVIFFSFEYVANFKPHLTECLEYMIENLQCNLR